LLSREHLVDGNGKVATTNSLASVAARATRRRLVAALGGAARAITADCLSFVVSILTLALIRAPDPKPSQVKHESSLRAEVSKV